MSNVTVNKKLYVTSNVSLTSGIPSPARAQLTVERACRRLSATGDAILLGGKMPALHVGQV